MADHRLMDPLPCAEVNAAPPALSLRRNVSWTFVGTVVYAGCQWGMLVLLAKLTSKEMVGRFALALAVTSPVVLFCGLSLRTAQATDARGEYAFGHYLALRLGTTVLAVALIAAMAFAGYRAETAWVIVAVGLAKAVEALADVYHGLMQQRERMDRIAISLMLRGPLALVALGGAAYATGGVSTTVPCTLSSDWA